MANFHGLLKAFLSKFPAIVLSLTLAGILSDNSVASAATAPSKPTGLKATKQASDVILSWTASTGAASYNVKRATVSGGPYTTIINAPTNTATDTSVNNATTYYYVVSAVNGSLESANSGQITVTMAPLAPAGFTASAGNGQVVLAWSASMGATSYEVKRAVSGGTWAWIVTGFTGTNYTDISVTNGVIYNYLVVAVYANVLSPNSTVVHAEPDPPPPLAPGGLTAKAGNAQVVLTWNASTGATSYNVKRAVSGGTWAWIATGLTQMTCTDTTVTNGTTYNYLVVALDIGASSPNSKVVKATPAATNPTAPTMVSAVAGIAQATVTFSGALANGSSITNYTVTSSPGGVTATGASSPVTVTGLTNGTAYTFSVQATNSIGSSVASPASNSVTPQPAIPAAPTGLSAITGNAQVQLTWKVSPGATSYNVKRSVSNGTSYTTIRNGLMANSFVDTSVNNFITYYYVVTAVNGGGESSNSNQASVTYIPQPPQLPSAPAGLTATAGNAQVGLNWTATQGALYYDVQREALGGTWALIAPYVPQPSYNDTSVTNGTTYNYQVAAVNAAGTGPWSAVASATTPVPPLPAGLFSVTQVGYYYSDGLGHSCDFASVNHLYSCGISPQDYNSPTVPNYNILPSNTISSGTCTCGLYSLPYTWQGPQTSFVVSPNQNAYVSISNVNYPPYWLTLVFPGGPGTTKYPNGYTNFESSLQNAKQAGMNIVEIALNSDELTSWPFNGNFQGCYTNNGINSCNQDDAYLEQVVSSLAEPVVPNVPYYIIFRISYQSSAARLGMYKPFNSGTDSIVRLDAMGDSYSDPSVDTNSQYSWFYHQQVVQNVLRYLDTNLPGRVIGFKTDEKFLTPSTQKSDGTWGPATNYLTGYFGDYSTSQSSAYCAWWSQLPSPPNVNCSMPNTSMRNATNDGTNFISGIDANSLNAIYFNQFSAVHLADTFKGLGQAVQDVSQGKAINSFFYGYANALDDDLPESQHTALGYAEGLPQINSFVSPYSYYNARNLGNAFFGGGVGDSAALYGKLYSNEDDLYTYLCAQKDPTCQNYYQTIGLTTMASGSLSNTISYLRRDFVTAAVRGQGLYLLDLDPNTAGSFSNSTDPSDTGTLWQAITQDLGTASKVDFTTQYNYVPEVAVFVDETAAAYEPLNQSANVSNGNLYRTHSFITGALEQLSQAGIVWREYLMSDLLNEKDPVPLDNVKFAIFLNPVNITSAIQTAIQNKLENSDRALLYVYAPGLFGQGTNSDVANPAQISAITGMNIVQGAGSLTNPQTQVSFDMPSTGAHPQPFGITDGGTWSPWFYVNDPYAVTLGTYILNNVPSNFSSLAWKQKQGYSVYYSALPFYSGEAISAPSLPSSPLAIPAPLLRYMASNAGVHFFTDIITDSVDAGGNTMVLNAMYTATRTVYLPWTVNEVDEDTDTGSTTDAVTTTICKNCSSFTVSLTGPDTHVYRWK